MFLNCPDTFNFVLLDLRERSDKLFVVGNGKDDSNRSNVFTVNTFGDVNI